jgi:hypothetical protein
MHRHAAWIACLLVAFVGGPADAEVTRRAASDFHRRAIVAGTITADTAYAVALSPDAVAALEKGGELRVFDGAGLEIPSLVHSATSRSEVIDRPVEIFNRVWTEYGTQMLSIEVAGRKPEAVNEFVFDIADEDYDTRVRVEAGQDGESWRILADGLHLIRHTVKREKIDYRHDVLRVPTARFRFYRFTLLPRAPRVSGAPSEGPAAMEPLEVVGVAVREVVRRGTALTVSARPERIDDPQDEDTRHHYWKLDFQRENLGIDRVTFTIPATDFARPVSLWEWSPERGRRTRKLASTVAFHFTDRESTDHERADSGRAGDEHSEFTGFSSDARILILMIDQGDDDPVGVTAARASRPRQHVRFLGPSVTTPPLALYLDPDEPREPSYDLARRLREREVTSFTQLTAGAVEPNPGYTVPAESRSERIPYLLYAIVIPLVLGLGWYVARTIQRSARPGENA